MALRLLPGGTGSGSTLQRRSAASSVCLPNPAALKSTRLCNGTTPRGSGAHKHMVRSTPSSADQSGAHHSPAEPLTPDEQKSYNSMEAGAETSVEGNMQQPMSDKGSNRQQGQSDRAPNERQTEHEVMQAAPGSEMGSSPALKTSTSAKGYDAELRSGDVDKGGEKLQAPPGSVYTQSDWHGQQPDEEQQAQAE